MDPGRGLLVYRIERPIDSRWTIGLLCIDTCLADRNLSDGSLFRVEVGCGVIVAVGLRVETFARSLPSCFIGKQALKAHFSVHVVGLIDGLVPCQELTLDTSMRISRSIDEVDF